MLSEHMRLQAPKMTLKRCICAQTTCYLLLFEIRWGPYLWSSGCGCGAVKACTFARQTADRQELGILLTVLASSQDEPISASAFSIISWRTNINISVISRWTNDKISIISWRTNTNISIISRWTNINISIISGNISTSLLLHSISIYANISISLSHSIKICFSTSTIISCRGKIASGKVSKTSAVHSVTLLGKHIEVMCNYLNANTNNSRIPDS